jgi:hypothetical protein
VGEPENKLAQMWMNDPDRAEIGAAADAIDRLLEIDPLGQGESREGDQRILFYPPLAVQYLVDAKNRWVYVLTIGRSNPIV